MKQHCLMINVWMTWLAVPVLVLMVGYAAGWIAGVAILVVAVAAEMLYLRLFPSISEVLGYGSVADDAPSEALPLENKVVLYTANVCPFCPLVRKRLQALQEQYRFDLEEIDVTFKPTVVQEKGIRAVPVVEAGGRLLSGNATSAELVTFLGKKLGREELKQRST